MSTESEPASDRYDKTSPWPIVVVLGLVFSEIGIVFGFYPLAIGGLAMFVGSVSGIVHEAGYVASPWRLLSGLGVALCAVGVLIVATQADVTAPSSFLGAVSGNAVEQRGITVTGTGVVLAALGVAAPRVLRR